MGYAARAHAHHAAYRALPVPLLLVLAFCRRCVSAVRRGGAGRKVCSLSARKPGLGFTHVPSANEFRDFGGF